MNALPIRNYSASLLSCLLVTCFGCRTTPHTTPDPIQRLVDVLSAAQPTGLTAGSWRDGMFPVIDLPRSASTKEVVAKVFGQMDNFSIVEVRQVSIGTASHLDPYPTYTATLLNVKRLGQQIVLFRYEGESAGWWSRAYPLALTRRAHL